MTRCLVALNTPPVRTRHIMSVGHPHLSDISTINSHSNASAVLTTTAPSTCLTHFHSFSGVRICSAEMGWEYSSEILLSMIWISNGRAVCRRGRTIGVSLAPGAGGSDLVLLASWEITHVPLRSGANGSILVMQTPEIVFWQLERERD